VAWLEPSSGRLTSQRLPEGVGHAKSLVVARDGTVWLGSDRGLWARRHNETEFSSIPLGRREDSGHLSVLRLLEDAAGRIWAGTHLHGTFMVKPGEEAAEPLRHPSDADLASDTVYALADAGNAEVWIGTYGGGVVRVNMTDGQVHRERHQVTHPASLLDDDVGAIFRGRDGIVWVATAFGLSRYDTRFDGIWTCYGGPEQIIRDTNVPAVLALADGRVVAATGAHGLQILGKDGVSTQLRADPGQPETALPRARVIALASTSDGTVWIGTLGGLYRASADGRHLRRVAISGRRPSDEIWALQVDGTTLWVGGPDGLWSLDVATAPPAAKHHFDRELGQLHVRALALGMQGELWIGTNGQVFRLDRERTDLRQLHNDPKNPEALMGVAVSSLLVDGRGHLWVATLGQGIQVQVGNLADGLPKFRRLTTKEGLPHNGIDALILDKYGNVWASTDNGVAQIDPLTLSSRWFRAAHGAGISTFWTGAATLTPEGDLLFGGQGGMLGLRPSKIPRLETSLAPPVITEAQIGSKSMTAAQLVANGEAVVPASVPRLQVEFASLAYGDQDVLRYSYRLEGFDIDWNDSSARGRSASYTKLPSGKYKLQIRVARQNGDWSAPREVALRVEPRWYERIEVQSIACLSVAFLAWYAHHWRLKRAAWRQAQLEDEVRQRTSELEQSRTQLRQLSMHNAQVLEQERARVSRELHDETAQQLAALKLEASSLRQLSRKSGQAEQLPVQNLVDRVDSIIRSIRELVTQLRPPVLDGGISPAIEWLAARFEEQTGIKCELDLQDHGVFSRKEVSTMAFRVVQESLDNIRRHAKATHVCIRMACTEKEGSLEIQDNGVGFDSKGSHAGYGLPGMELRVMALGGHFQVTSSADDGTTVRVTISTGR
jgi:signal transduction histidine kinase/ligand-binding sensor domain-containing protein